MKEAKFSNSFLIYHNTTQVNPNPWPTGIGFGFFILVDQNKLKTKIYYFVGGFALTLWF